MKALVRRRPRFGSRLPQQHHPVQTPSRCGGGLAARGCVVVALVLAYLNYLVVHTTIGSSSSNQKDNRGNQVVERLPWPPLPEIRYPPIELGLPLALIQEWDQWANEPMVGSYSFPFSNRQSPVKTNLLLPIIDIDTNISGRSARPGLESSSDIHRVGVLLDATAMIDLNLASPNHVVLTRRGDKYSENGMRRQPNQDRVCIMTVETTGGGSPSGDNGRGRNQPAGPHNGDWWIGLFDGHGPFGHVVAQYSSLEFAKRMEKQWSGPTETTMLTVQDTLKQIFLDIHRSMPHLDGSGSTAISVWRRNKQLYISNLGDSLAFVVRYDPRLMLSSTDASYKPVVEIVYKTEPHKPDSPNERKRIESAGGTVQDPPIPGLSARLLIPTSDGLDMMGLAMSRSLGDHDGEAHGLLAEPTTDVLDLTGFDKKMEYFVVACTDGLVDRIEPLEVAQEMAKAFSSGQKVLPIRAAERLILKSSDLWKADVMDPGYRDDISIVAHKLVLH